MGEIIRKTAAHEDIIADLRRTLLNARARGGRWKELAEEQLAPVTTLIDGVDGRLTEARGALDVATAELQGRREDANAALGKVADDAWNAVGRPASDPAFSLLFPGGVASYTHGDVTGQPARMDLLAELLETNGHPRLDPATAKAFADKVRTSATPLRAAVGAARDPSDRVEMLQRVRRAVVLSAQVALANLKRSYKLAGFSEADIHTVIPDHRSQGRRPAAAQQPQPTPAPEQPPPQPAPPATDAHRA